MLFCHECSKSMGSACIWFLSLILCWGLPLPHTKLSYAAVYYVTPHRSNSNCPPGEPCLTLNEYAQENYFDRDDNISLLFLNGEHNLTVERLEIGRKTTLKMAPRYFRTEMVQLSCSASIIVRNVLNLDVSNLKFTTHCRKHSSYRSALFSLSNIGLLSLSQLSIDSFMLLLEEGIGTSIFTQLTASSSSIFLGMNQGNHTLVIQNSELHFSTITISDNNASQIINSDTSSKELNIRSSFLSNSLVAVRLRSETFYKLLVENTSIISNGSEDRDTGINIEVGGTATTHVFVINCNITGNNQGINILADEDSQLQLRVDDSYIGRNGHRIDQAGGVSVTHSDESNALTITNITSTTLSGNTYSQIGIFSYSGTARVFVFNSTIQDTVVAKENGRLYFAFGAGAYFVFGGGQNCSRLYLNFTQNVFENNYIGINLVGEDCKHEVYFVRNIVALNGDSISESGGGLQLSTDCNDCIVSIANCVFSYNKPSALSFESPSGLITITETVITQNENGLLVNSIHPGNVNIVVKDSFFQENNGVSLGVQSLFPLEPKAMNITVKNVTFLGNINNLASSGIIQVDGRVTLSIEDSCEFRDNLGSVLQAFTTSVTLSGRVTFKNNAATRGGAISLSYSTLVLASVNNTNTSIYFVNNTATVAGGAIYIQGSINIDSFFTKSSCFYELQGISKHELLSSVVNMALTFINNEATNGGADIYGATPNSVCIMKFNDRSEAMSYKIKDKIFKFSSSLSSVSSDPMRVCLCDSLSQLMCANLSYIYHNTTRYPGEVFSLSLAVVGFGFGTVTGPVFARLLPQANNSISSLGRGQYVRQTDYKTCTHMKFTVNSLKSRETIFLTARNDRVIEKRDVSVILKNDNSIYSAVSQFNLHQIVLYSLLKTPVFVDVSLLDCPPGFELFESGRCGCSKVLQQIGINECSIFHKTPYITRSENQWVKAISNRSGIYGVLYTKYCPLNYCNHTRIMLDLNDPDKQCVLDHTGILCGACPSNLSLAIGSSRCLECSNNNHTLLLIAFAAAGILLVLFIKIFDLTVTKGLVNGLIFYANIVWASQHVFFPPQIETSSLLQILKTFIAWLNLDVGIETCFIQHLDGYWKTWLQFAFPAYIWLIAGLIILISHYSIKVTKILGDNSVSVLATLFLLSYTKLLRTILTALEFTVLKNRIGYELVWSFDGNFEYFGLKHSILLIIAVCVLLALWLPYLLVLLLIQCLRKYSDRTLLKWVSQLKPLFDSYLGPLKPKYHYWVGINLLARLFLLLISTVTLTIVPFITALVIALTTTLLCCAVLSVYNQSLLGVLEGCFLFNLAMFSSGVLYIEAQRGSKDSLACTSLGITFVLFLVIVGFHGWKKLQSLSQKIQQSTAGNNNANITIPHANQHGSELRESLLESLT